jgi:uncharacterized protein (TIGR02996 family)
MPRFEFAQGTSSKFWEITVSDSNLTTRWGRIGTDGQNKMQAFASPAAAKKEHDKLILSKLKKGYIEVPGATEEGRARAAAAIAARTAAAKPARPAPSDRSFRRFEWEEHGARCFHEVTLNGSAIDQRWGEVRDEEPDPDDDVRDATEDGKHATARHPRPADAREIFEHILQVFSRRGYRLVAQDDDESVEEPVLRTRTCENPELEATCRASPGAPEPWAVYADWLMGEGDPRGELAALHCNGKENEARKFLKAHGARLLGDLEAHLGGGIRELRWRHGFPIGATLVNPDADSSVKLDELTRAFLALPLARFIESLRFGLASYASDNDWTSTLAAVTRAEQAPRVRELLFNDYTYEDCEISWTPFGDFSKAWAKLPALEVLHVRSGAGGVLGELALPSLTTFIRESGGLRASEIASICAARWPKLVHLEVWFGGDAYGAEGNVAAIRSILDGEGLPNLTHLGLVNCEFVDDLIPALARSTVLSRLRTLDLSKGTMARSAAEALVLHAAAFAHLESIDLDENLLLDEELAQIAKALPNAVHGEQRDRDEDDDDDEGNRYAAVGE